jgi:hypothetical protein
LTVTGLAANTQYYYGVEISGILQTVNRGSFKTFPTGGSTFTCAFSACAGGITPNREPFTHILDLNPAFFLHMGDMHYDNHVVNDPDLYRTSFDNVFSVTEQQELYRQIPTPYIWDDHDYSGNDSDSTAVSREAATLVYRERVPHYTLPEGEGAHPIYQSFVCGRVRFILTDLRSARSPKSQTDDINKSMMGETQLQWFFDQLIQPEPLKIWVSSMPWIGAPNPGSDFWGSYTNERTRIAEYIKDKNLAGRVMILSGDMHGMAIDDGTNSDYAGGAPIPVFQAAPLSSIEGTKGGPYTYGPFLNGELGNQYGIMNVTDTGGATLSVEWLAKRGTETLATHVMEVVGTPYTEPGEFVFTDPTDLEGLALWIDPATSPMTMNGSNIQTIEDQSGNGNHLSQANAPTQPALASGLHGVAHPFMQFNGTSNQFLQNLSAVLPLTNQVTLFVVAAIKQNGDGKYRPLFEAWAGASETDNSFQRVLLYKSSTNILISQRNTAPSGTGATLDISAQTYKPTIFTVAIGGGSNTLYKDAVLANMDSHSSYDSTSLSDIARLKIGMRMGGTHPFEGEIGEIIVYSGKLTSTNLEHVHNYLKDKWGIA